MDSNRKTALIAGIFFALTFIASIPALLLYHPVLHDVNYIASAGADTRVTFGAFLEISNCTRRSRGKKTSRGQR